MRHLVIMRHAKAEHGYDKPDFERMLEPRGIADADSVGGKLAALDLVPDTVLCSASRRTRDTLAAVLPHIGRDCVVHLRRSLYDAEVADLRDAVRTARGQCILLIGHNPSVHGLALAFAGSNPEAAELQTGFPTSHAAVFSMGFAVDTVKFERVVTP
ncbi:SixA phosphatase family protein [Acuticoccus kandeliae]|uniref:SixA phosphatase family protein n=1 Tax=Acuticoccus kandeliae TaxID=2073160 RepID=UPI000D3E94D9|nr:histidine phosphatase family protein [Acuticoccus kandeliae]